VSLQLLAIEFIAKYCKHFKSDQTEADVSNIFINLVDESSLSVRMAAIDQFPSIISSFPNELVKLADVLLQLLSTGRQLLILTGS
jgi:hypothetical protein